MPAGYINRLLAASLILAQIAMTLPVAAFAEEEEFVIRQTPAAASAAELIRAGEGGTVRLGGAEIEIPPGALARDTEIRITRLWRTEDTGDGLKNATSGGGGYRFEPAGTRFSIPATIRIRYDADLSESAQDTLYTYYFNTNIKQWEQLEKMGLESDSVVSLTTHFTDMINGTLSLPEGPAPLRFNINSIKGLEAANPSAGVPGIEGLEANNTGSASFSIPIEIPPGRAGMTPRVAVTYSSDGGNGILGRGFDLQAGGRIATDTRWGVPRFNGTAANTGGFERDAYLLDGVKLEQYGPIGNTISYRALREAKHERIERVIRENNRDTDYWVVTDRRGTKRVYGKSAGAWSGRSESEKHVWELEEERDIFGNTIKYRYAGGNGQLFLEEIEYTGSEKQGGLAAYGVIFEYEGRQDVRVDGRGGYAGRTDRLLKGIRVEYRKTLVRSYKMEYETNMFGASQMTRFGQTRWDDGDKYFWSYRFDYEELEGERLFAPPVQWWGAKHGLQVQTGVTSGGQGSLSGGVGIGPSGGGFDVRVNGGGTFSMNGGTSEVKQTFIDLTGDGRPDSVSVSDNGLEVWENTGNGFNWIPVGGDLPGSLGKDASGGFTGGFTVGAGIGFDKFGVGVSYTRTGQTGWSSSSVGFADIDGDGMIDVIVSGESHYYRNVSEEGQVRFKRLPLPVYGLTRLPDNMVETVKEDERKELGETFYHETPLREWRAPEKGSVRITQDVTAKAGRLPPSADGVAAKTYRNNEDAPLITMEVGGTRPAANNDKPGVAIGAEESLYFISDAGEDTRGDDIEWGITISYERMRYFGDMDRGMHYAPPKTDVRSSVAGYVLGPLYDETEDRPKAYALSGRDWEKTFPPADKALRKRAWDEIVRLGWFAPGYVSAKNFQALWDTATERDTEAERTGGEKNANRQVLVTYYRYHAGEDAYIRNDDVYKEAAKEDGTDEEDGGKRMDRFISGLIREANEHESRRGICERLAGYAWGPEGTVTYPVPNGGGPEGAYALFTARETITRREKDKPGYIYETATGSRRLVLDIVEGEEWSVEVPPAALSAGFIILPIGYQGDENRIEIPFFINGEWRATARTGIKNGQAVITVPFEYEDTLQCEASYFLPGFQRTMKDLGAEEIEYVRLREQKDEYTLNGGRWRGELSREKLEPVLEYLEDGGGRDLFMNAFLRVPPAQAGGEDAYVLREDMSGAEEGEINSILERYGKHVFISEFEERFPWYEVINGERCELKAEYANPQSTEYGNVVNFCIKYNFIHYIGVMDKEIVYYAGGMHPINGEGGVTVWMPETGGEGERGYAPRSMTGRRTRWESGEDYSGEQRRPFSYAETRNTNQAAGALADIMEELTGVGEIPAQEYTVEIGPERMELLYGGINRWYYAVWIGDQGRDEHSFRQEKLYKQKNEGIENAAGSMEEQKAKVRNDAKEIGKNNGGAPRVYYQPVTTAARAQAAAAPPGRPAAALVEREYGREIEEDALVGTVSRTVQNIIDGDTVTTTEMTYFSAVHRNRIHSTRAGGLSYYEIPGMFPPEDGDGTVMPDIRRSRSANTDESWNFSGSFDSGRGEDLTDKLKTFFNIDAALNIATNTGSSRMYQSVQGMGGNGLTDILVADGDGIKVTEGSRRGFNGNYRIPFGDISHNKDSTFVIGGTAGAGGSVKIQHTGTSRVSGLSLSAGGGGSHAGGSTSQDAGFADVNGDGLPDYVSGGTVTLNLGREKWGGGGTRFSGLTLNEGGSNTTAVSVSLGTGGQLGDKNGSNYAGHTAEIGGGLNYSVSMMETKSMLIDINGDGLPDMVSASDGIMQVRFNLGDHFGEEEIPFVLPGWNIANEKSKFANNIDGSMMEDVFKNMPLVGDILEKTGLNTMFSKNDVKINPYGDDIQNYLKKLETTSSISINVSLSVNIGSTLSFELVSSGLILNITLGGGGGFNSGANTSGVTMRLTDMDGDGLPDRVLRVPGTDYVYVQRNLSGRVGLLKKISLPQGGEYALDYKWERGTREMPQSRYVLSEVVTRDNCGENGLANPAFPGAHKYAVRYTYTGGYYDREEKEFYGFRQVSAKPVDGEKPLGETVTEYYVDAYHLRGMTRRVTTKDEKGNMLRFAEYTADAAPFARNVREETEAHELIQEGVPVTTSAGYEYDAYGNVTRLEQRAGGSETVTAAIRYWDDDALYLHAHPREITVRGSESGLLRKRVGEYDHATGALTTLTQMHGETYSSQDGVSVIEWDAYGNLAKITDPGGAFVSYKYDELRQYVEEITAGGRGIAAPYRSRIEWDKALGKKTKETDENRQNIDYAYDKYGRLVEVWSPYDKYGKGGRTPAVSYRYLTPETGNWSAVTENKVKFDSNNGDTLATVITIDGLGRALFTAKQGETWKDGVTKKGWNVSGFTAYDAKGRNAATGQPLFAEFATADALAGWNLKGYDLLVNPTEYEYDALDRAVKTTLPAGPGERRPVQTASFAIRSGRTVAITVDPLGNMSEQEADGQGNIVLVRRLDKFGKELTRASYIYNGLGEMLRALDADNNPLSSEYDRLGRRTKLSSADIGVKEWRYDASGNVVSETDSELSRQGKRIQYDYDGMNRLLKITYPFSEATVYEYGAAGREDNAAGRVVKLTDETGSISYRYGLLGQVEEETRVIRLLPLSGGKTKTASMKYESNYLGQMEKITYPDGETVRYTYNHGGQISKVTGIRIGTEFPYVKNIGYDEYGQRAYIEYGSGVKTKYAYDPYRRWLSTIRTESPEMGNAFQDIKYTFDAVGNVLRYENTAYGHTTTQNYSYDGLYQLIEAKGVSRSHPYGSGTEYTTDYQQDFSFNKIGNMTKKTSKEYVSNTNRIGVNLNYNLDYAYYAGTHMAERIGNRYYDYDRNGNLIAEREGGHAVTPEVYRPYYQDGDLYYADYGFGLVRPNAAPADDGVYRRNYRWNERNLLSESSDSVYTVQYRYGADGQRALKFTANTGRSTVYFNKMWQVSDTAGGGLQSKHIYVNEDRITTKYNSEGNDNTAAEKERTYYYHSDHLGSAQTVTNYRGQVHERLEYTPYGELWIDWRSDLAPEDATPFRFTGKELDAETGLYYYGARYLDPKTGRWLSGDPAMGEYFPSAPVSDEARKHNGNLPGQGGVFNYVNLHAYHYAGNNPVKYVDPDGRDINLENDNLSYDEFKVAEAVFKMVMNSDTDVGGKLRELYNDSSKKLIIKFGRGKQGQSFYQNGNSFIYIEMSDIGMELDSPEVTCTLGAIIAHEAGHAHADLYNYNPRGETALYTKILQQHIAIAVENNYRNKNGMNQRETDYIKMNDVFYFFEVPQWDNKTNSWTLRGKEWVMPGR
jgi:RHS repeat-associated protein